MVEGDTILGYATFAVAGNLRYCKRRKRIQAVFGANDEDIGSGNVTAFYYLLIFVELARANPIYSSLWYSAALFVLCPCKHYNISPYANQTRVPILHLLIFILRLKLSQPPAHFALERSHHNSAHSSGNNKVWGG